MFYFLFLKDNGMLLDSYHFIVIINMISSLHLVKFKRNYKI